MSLSDPTVGTVDEVIITSELWRRPKRVPNFEAESQALESLASVMSQSPDRVFQTLVNFAQELCGAGSAGISVRETTDTTDVFRWRAISGEYLPYLGEKLPRDFSPCGTVIDRNACLLMADPVRFFPYIDQLSSPVREVLLVPFHEGTTPIGTVWVVSHEADRKFDAEDARLITNLTKIAAAAISTLDRIQKAEAAEAEIREIRTRIESTLIAGEVGTWVFDINRNQVRADRNLARMFGIHESDAAGGPLEAYIKAIHPDDRQRVSDQINHAIDSGSTFDAEYRLISTGGGVNWVVARGTVERDAAGRALRLPGVIVDITGRKAAEEKLRASEVRRQLALDAGELGTWNIDPITKVMTTDERFRLIFTGTTQDLT